MTAAEFSEPDRGLLAAGLCWLYDTVQPGDAIIQHHGTGHGYADGTRSYGFTSHGADDLPTITIHVRNWEWGPDGNATPVLTATEMDATAAAITELGHVIFSGRRTRTAAGLRASSAQPARQRAAAARLRLECVRSADWRRETRVARR